MSCIILSSLLINLFELQFSSFVKLNNYNKTLCKVKISCDKICQRPSAVYLRCSINGSH